MCAADGYALPDHVWRMEPGKPLVFEAEDYTEARFYPNAINGLREEADASGGKAIYQFPHYRNQLRYDFSLPTAGKYRIWYRIRFDQIGQNSNLHLASMDNSGMTGQHVTLPAGYTPARGWVVMPGPVYLLSAGLHSFYLHGRFDYQPPGSDHRFAGGAKARRHGFGG